MGGEHSGLTPSYDAVVHQSLFKSLEPTLSGGALQKNIGILTGIPTKNEILGISRKISEDIPKKHKIWFPRNFLRIYRLEFRGNINPSEYSYGIPRKNIFLGKNR